MNGEILTAPDLNAGLVQAATTNSSFPCLADYSSNAAQMQATTDPGGSGTESLATSGAGELERLRFALRRMHGQTYWYTNPDPFRPPGDVQFGHATVQTARAIFYHSSSAFFTRFSAGNATQDQWYFWPTARPTANNQVLASTTGGAMAWVSAGTIDGGAGGGGWTDDGTIVRLTTATDQVGIGTASNFRTGAALTLVGSLDWTSGDGVLPDTQLFRIGAQILAMRNTGGAGSQFRLYSAFTDANNGAWMAFEGSGGMTSTANGTGTITPITIRSTGTDGVTITATSGVGGWMTIPTRSGVWEPQAHRTAGTAIGDSAKLPTSIHIGTDYNLWIPQTAGRLRLLFTNTYATIDAAATTTVAQMFPAGSVGLGVTVRVDVVIPTAATFDVGVSGATTRYGSGLSVSAGTTNVGPSVNGYTALTDIVITPNLTPAANTGRVRVTSWYFQLVANTDETSSN